MHALVVSFEYMVTNTCMVFVWFNFYIAFTKWCWVRRMNTRFSCNLSYCTVSLWSILLAQHQHQRTLNDFIKRLKQTGSTITRKSGSGRTRTAQTTANIDAFDKMVLSQEDEYAFLSQSVILYCEFLEHPPGSTPVRQQRRCWRSLALFLSCQYQTFFLSIQFVSNA